MPVCLSCNRASPEGSVIVIQQLIFDFYHPESWMKVVGHVLLTSRGHFHPLL